MDEFTKRLHGVLDRVSSFFPQPKQKIISPLSKTTGGDLTQPENLYYVQMNQQKEEAAQKYNKQLDSGEISASSYPDFQYNPEIANAPQKKISTHLTPNSSDNKSSKKKSYDQPISQIPELPKDVGGVDQDFVDTLNNVILPITRKAGIPDAVAAGQSGAESGYGGKKNVKDTNNWFGLMSQKGGRHLAKYKTFEDAVNDYVLTVKNLVKTNTGKDISNFKDDPIGILKAVQGKTRYESDNPDPMQYVYDVSNTPVWTKYGGGQPMEVNPTGWAK